VLKASGEGKLAILQTVFSTYDGFTKIKTNPIKAVIEILSS
jgi:hypothetical protein